MENSAPPIPNDYTIADLRSAPADCAESYELLKKLAEQFYEREDIIGALNNLVSVIENKTGEKVNLEISENFIEQPPDSNIPNIGLSWEERDIINKILYDIDQALLTNNHNEIPKIIDSNAVIIQQSWEKDVKIRNIIHQLNEFPEIAESYEPSPMNKTIKVLPLIALPKLYCAYAYLQTEPNDINIITNELITLDSVLKKVNLNARSTVSKLVYLTMIEININTANVIANKSGISQETLELLTKHFTPITEQHMSLRNSIIYEYLFFKDIIVKHPNLTIFKSLLLFKENSTLRILRNKCDDSLNTLQENNELQKERLSVWPNFYPFKEASLPNYNDGDLISYFHHPYTWYNPVGTMFTTTDIFEKLARDQKLLIKIKVRDALLQIILKKRLGVEANLEAGAYSDEYIIDIENKYIASPGPDENIGTRDDIKLPINPEVLGFTKQ